MAASGSGMGRCDERSVLERASLAAALVRSADGDKAQLKRLGVVHTPLPLVHAALGRIERALRRDLSLPAGLASERLQVLDPALGTGIWLSAVLASIRGRGAPHALLGFEADGAVLEAARALLAPAACAQGVPLVLAHENTLTRADPWLPGDHVRLVLGNPPWAARSLSRGLALSDAWLREFYCDAAGQPLRERRSGVLSDDYVRFFRWALEQARAAPAGAVVCFITNASYLDGPVYRGMRAALVSSFDRIETVDLGGSSLRSRDACVDEPMFPVRVGAALSLCVRLPKRQSVARSSYLRLTGTRAEKLGALAQLDDEQEGACAFTPAAPWFRLVTPPAAALQAGFGLDEAFPFHAEGVQTNRDTLATHPDREALLLRLGRIASGALPLPASGHLSPERVRRELLRALAGESEVVLGKLAYRPLETRFFCTVAPLCHRPRPLLARAVQASELCLLATRKEPGSAPWNMFALSPRIADSSYLSVRSSCRTRVFPSHDAVGAPNLAPQVLARLEQRIGRGPSAAELLRYAVGVLGAPSYRRAHAAALKLDYPHIPWPLDAEQFTARVNAGALFERALADAPVSQHTLAIRSDHALTTRVGARTLRWLSPQLLEVCPGTQIGASDGPAFRAAVGHHELATRAAHARDGVTIADVYQASERSALWAHAERAADNAYQPASSVGGAAKVFAPGD